jgi:hypothetical protein
MPIPGLNPENIVRYPGFGTTGSNPFPLLTPRFGAGTGSLGAIDPIQGMADIVGTSRLWLHVDGAYGGSYLLSEGTEGRLAGLER